MYPAFTHVKWVSRTHFFLLFCLSLLVGPKAGAHPMPNTLVLLTVHDNRIDAAVQIPLSELQAAFGHAVNDSAAGLIQRLGPQLRAYLKAHTRLQTPGGKPWTVSVGQLSVQETQNPINGTYRELTAQLQLLPPPGTDVRTFVLHYDAVLHQVVTHKILVSIRQDWALGHLAEQAPVQVGVIELDIVNNQIRPLSVQLEAGSSWAGFGSMVRLGIRHIADGTDHLLFLLVLLLPAPLRVEHRRWGRFGGVGYSLKRLLRIVTAFTIGHSLTLLLGTLATGYAGRLPLPDQPIEVAIAFSILVSALHALRPLFPHREAWVTTGFGLIHGLAFASTLINLHLDAGPLALSILGFNLGIELMQLFVIALTIPWLLLLSRTATYAAIRLLGAGGAAVAALAWMVERITGQTNPLTVQVDALASYAPLLLIGLALLAGVLSWQQRQRISH